MPVACREVEDEHRASRVCWGEPEAYPTSTRLVPSPSSARYRTKMAWEKAVISPSPQTISSRSRERRYESPTSHLNLKSSLMFSFLKSPSQTRPSLNSHPWKWRRCTHISPHFSTACGQDCPRRCYLSIISGRPLIVIWSPSQSQSLLLNLRHIERTISSPTCCLYSIRHYSYDVISHQQFLRGWISPTFTCILITCTAAVCCLWTRWRATAFYQLCFFCYLLLHFLKSIVFVLTDFF